MTFAMTATARAFVRDFFALYKSLPCLWNKTHLKYNNDFQKNCSMGKLTEMYIEVSPDATPASVSIVLKKYIKCLQKEHKRRKKGSMANCDIWYYDDLSFLLDNTSKPVFILEENHLNQSKEAVKQRVLKPKRQTENDKTSKCFIDDKETQLHTNVAAAKKPSVPDKYDILAEHLRSLPTEQFSYIINILQNVFNFAHRNKNNQESMDLLASTSRQEAPQPIAANTETVQVAKSNNNDTQMTSVQANLKNSRGSNSPNLFTSSSITGRQDVPQPIIVQTVTVQELQSNINHSQMSSVQTNLNSLQGPNSIISRRPEVPRSIAADMETVQVAQSNAVDTQMTSVCKNLDSLYGPNWIISRRPEVPQSIFADMETVQVAQSNVVDTQMTSVHTNINSPSGLNSIISRRPEVPQSMAANMETVQVAQSNTVDTQMTSVQTNLESLYGLNLVVSRKPEVSQSIAANMETVQVAQSNTVYNPLTNLIRARSPYSQKCQKPRNVPRNLLKFHQENLRRTVKKQNQSTEFESDLNRLYRYSDIKNRFKSENIC